MGGYCAPAAQEETASAPSSAGSPANSTASGSAENLDTIISNLTKIQGEELKAYEASLYEDVTNSGGLTPAGIAVVVVVRPHCRHSRGRGVCDLEAQVAHQAEEAADLPPDGQREAGGQR